MSPSMNVPDILKEIVEAKRREVERLKEEAPLPEVMRLAEARRPALNLAGALTGETVRIIAEVKKASPSAGVLREDYDPASLARTYVAHGAAAISVLTNAHHFQGSIAHLEAVHAAVNSGGTPVLRKEFIFDTYQVWESRAHGADAILLIASILTPGRLRELLEVARQTWMQCLVEVHDEDELRTALEAGAEIVGINNRDLRTFTTDLRVTERLAPLVPAGRLVVSESGISGRVDVQRVRRGGAHAVLVGEALMRAKDPGEKLRELR